MTLEQLRIFLEVAKQLHFTRAAEELYITQPAVSAAVQSLETYFGVKLFHRIGRHIEITDAGILLQTEAKDILDRVKLMERGLRELNDLQRGELKLGSSLTIGNYWLPAKISQFQEQYPNRNPVGMFAIFISYRNHGKVVPKFFAVFLVINGFNKTFFVILNGCF